ncbi:MAG: hypothetical protein ACPLXC_01370 [Candidatus Pacearchaeota archaeon]
MAKKEATIDLIMENMIALQKILTSLASELKTLNKKVSDLFELFEETSASFREGAIAGEGIPTDISEKIDKLVEQNKTLAKGLLLLEKAVREREAGAGTMAAETATTARTMPLKTLKKRQSERQAETEEEYQPQPLPEFSF